MLGRLRVAWLGMGAVMLATVLVGVADDHELPTAFVRATPKTNELVSMEETILRIAKQVVPCTVGIQVGGNIEGSGVVISESGYVLTAAHVIGRPGRDVVIRFPDGTKVAGRTLGIHTQADGGLIKIKKEGKWPFAPMVTHEDYPVPGDWCISTGHPGGFQSKRTPPVRIGRVIDVEKNTLRTDCTITGGDSGGPLFDMQGRVIGIHSRISEESSVNLHGPVLAYVEVWEALKAGKIYPPPPPSRFLIHFDPDRDGKVVREDLPDGDLRSAYDRLVKSYNLDKDKTYSIEELAKAIEWTSNQSRRLELTPYRPDSSANSLDKTQFVRGKAVLDAFKPIVSTAAKSTVQVFCDGKRQLLGLVVSKDGLVVTKASRLHGKIECRTRKGKKFAAEILMTDPRNDLAVLKLDATSLQAAVWADTDELLPGQWLATPDASGAALSVGVVSVAKREIAGTPGVLGVKIRSPAGEPTVEEVMELSGAKVAGMLAGDVIILVMGKPVKSLKELQTAVGEHRPGEILKTTVKRNGKTIEMKVRLGMPADLFPNDPMAFRFGGSDGLNGPLNQRRDDFPAAIQHDSVLLPSQCGGPVVNVSGEVIGINVARANRIVSYALPCGTVRKIVAEARSMLAETETKSDTTTN